MQPRTRPWHPLPLVLAHTLRDQGKFSSLHQSPVTYSLWSGYSKKDAARGLTGRKDGRGVKRGRDEVCVLLDAARCFSDALNKFKDDSSKKPEMKLNVPEPLKVLLVDDWEAVTKNNQVRRSISRRNTSYTISNYSWYHCHDHQTS